MEIYLNLYSNLLVCAYRYPERIHKQVGVVVFSGNRTNERQEFEGDFVL